MKTVSILCTDAAHPVNLWIEQWAQQFSSTASVSIHRDSSELQGGDFLFLVSCHQIIRKPTRDLFRYTLVLHASALPNRRGMSPHIWTVLAGESKITLSMLNAEDQLDSGDIWHQIDINLSGQEIFSEINDKLFSAELEMLTWAIQNCESSLPRPQVGVPSFCRKRTPEDSRIDPQKSIAEQFDLLRVADPERYPAFFEQHGRKFRIRIDPM